MKLSNRILLSYIMLLLVAFLIAGVISTNVTRKGLLADARSGLHAQADSVIEFLADKDEIMSDTRRLVKFFRGQNLGGLITSDLIMLSNTRQVVYTTNETMSQELLREIFQKEHPDYIRVIRAIEHDDQTLGYLMLIAEIRHVEQSTKVLRNALFRGMLIAMVVGLVIAMFMRSRIVKPIRSLRNDILAATEDASHEVTILRTNDELEELYVAFDDMNQAINAHMDERKRFFQNASHELKTPLMSIQGYAEAIRDGVVEGDEVNESLDIIIRKSQQLKKTVEGIIYLSKLINQDFEYRYKDTDLIAVIQSAIADQSFAAAEKNIHISLDSKTDSLRLSLDEEKMSSVFENLLSNGLRYADTMIKVQVVEETDRVIIRVMDDGEGLQNGEDTMIFERFYKGEGGKSGIGLAIVDEIVKSHDGVIRAGNHIGGGAAFEITLDKKE